MEIETTLNNNNAYTAIATPVGEVKRDTNLNCKTEITENLQDSLIELEIPAAEMEIDMYEDKLNAAEVEQIKHLYEGIKDQSIPVVFLN